MNKLIVYLLILLLMGYITALAQGKGKLAQFEVQIAEQSDDEDEDAEGSGTLEILVQEIENDESEDTAVDEVIVAIDAVGKVCELSFGLLFHIPDLEPDIRDVGYTDYPYSYPNMGIYALHSPKTYSIIARVNYFQHSKELSGFSFKSRFSPHPFINLEFDYSNLVEQVGFDYDYLRFYDFFVNFNRIKNRHIALWWGLGIKAMGGDQNYSGFAFNLGTEIFPINPMSLELRYSHGFLNQTNVREFSVNVNCHIQRLKFYVGYQNFSAGLISIGGFAVGAGIYL